MEKIRCKVIGKVAVGICFKNHSTIKLTCHAGSGDLLIASRKESDPYTINKALDRLIYLYLED